MNVSRLTGSRGLLISVTIGVVMALVLAGRLLGNLLIGPRGARKLIASV